MDSFLVLLAGTFYGLIVGIIPGAGATTGLVAVFSFIHLFQGDPYLGVIFCMAVVAASTTGDTYTGVILGIPGASSSAATVVDGFPLAKQGKAAYAISAAVATSTVNGILWGGLVFMLLPWYTQLLLVFRIPELWGFMILALATVGFIVSDSWYKSLTAIFLGLGLGLIGTDPNTNADRWTMGWDYLGDGIQLLPMVCGLFAIPELLDGLKNRSSTSIGTPDFRRQTIDGLKVSWKYKWLGLKGGAIGAFIGALPGLGGATSDWMAYGATVASNPKETFGDGNIKGVIGPEGSNNAQKATSMIPTVLFGIPGASFAAVIMALFMYLDFDLGSYDLAYDQQFFDSLTYGFMFGTIIVGILCLLLTQFIVRVTLIPYKYYFPALLCIIIWATVQYTGGWEDYILLLLCSILGLLCKRFKFSRPGMLLAFIIAPRFEALTYQISSLYTLETLASRPIFVGLMAVTLAILLWGIFKRNKLNYT
jgi:TctA family transporter